MKLIFLLTGLGVCGLAVAEEAPVVELDIRRLQAPKPQTEPIPEIYAKEPTARLVLEDLKRDESGLNLHAVLRIINPTDQPLVFTGFSEKSPVTQQQRWQDGKWVAVQQFLRCGTGLRPCTIAPGQSAVFSISAPPERLPLRVGISASDGSKGAERQMLWSEKIEP